MYVMLDVNKNNTKALSNSQCVMHKIFSKSLQ